MIGGAGCEGCGVGWGCEGCGVGWGCWDYRCILHASCSYPQHSLDDYNIAGSYTAYYCYYPRYDTVCHNPQGDTRHRDYYLLKLHDASRSAREMSLKRQIGSE